MAWLMQFIVLTHIYMCMQFHQTSIAQVNW